MPARAARPEVVAQALLSLDDRSQLAAGARAVVPVLLGVMPFGLVTGVAMVAAGIDPAAAVAMSVLVYAGASMLAAAQLLAGEAPVAVIVLTAVFVNLRFMMYSASMRQHLGRLAWRPKLVASYLLADNAYALSIARFTEHPEMRGKLGFFLGAAVPVWVVWQLAVTAGVLAGARVPASWQLEFAAPLAFIAMTVPLLRDRAMVAAALAAAATVVLAQPLPMRLGVAAAGVVGIAAGMLASRSRSR